MAVTKREYYSLHGECKLINSYNTNNFNTTLEFWNDDTLIQSYVLTPDSIPFTFDLNVSNCDNLKINFYDNDAVSGGTSFGLINMELSNDPVVAQDSNDYNQSGNIINGGHGVYYNGTYYLSGESLRKIEQDNSETILLDKTVYYLNAHKDYLYFTESDDDCIYRIKTDGTGLEQLYSNPSHELTLCNDMLYFCADMGNNRFSICKMSLDGANQTELFSHNEWYLNVVGDYVYFTDYDDGRKIKRMNLDGSNISTIIDLMIHRTMTNNHAKRNKLITIV